MKYLLAFLLLATPLKAQIVVGDTSSTPNHYGFVVDTTMEPKVDPTKPWIWEVTPRALVKAYWFEEANCQGLDPHPGFFETLRFFFVNSYGFGWGHLGVGFSVLQDRAIYLAYPVAGDPALLKHEMLHYLLQLAGFKVGHPLPQFERCGVTVHYPK